MPNYLITIHLKTGKPLQGIRWHSSPDVNMVRSIVSKKVKLAVGIGVVDWIDIVPTARTPGNKMDVKSL